MSVRRLGRPWRTGRRLWSPPGSRWRRSTTSAISGRPRPRLGAVVVGRVRPGRARRCGPPPTARPRSISISTRTVSPSPCSTALATASVTASMSAHAVSRSMPRSAAAARTSARARGTLSSTAGRRVSPCTPGWFPGAGRVTHRGRRGPGESSGRPPSWPAPPPRRSCSGGQASRSRSSTTRSASRPGWSVPRRSSCPSSQAGPSGAGPQRVAHADGLLGPPGRSLVDRAAHARRRSRPAGRAPRPGRPSRWPAASRRRAGSGRRRRPRDPPTAGRPGRGPTGRG